MESQVSTEKIVEFKHVDRLFEEYAKHIVLERRARETISKFLTSTKSEEQQAFVLDNEAFVVLELIRVQKEKNTVTPEDIVGILSP